MGVFSKLKDSLKKTREGFFKRVKRLLSFETLDAAALEEIEELLILSDMGSETVEEVIEALRERTEKGSEPVEILQEVLIDILDIPFEVPQAKPYVVSVVGVNGTGKTTTIGKLSKLYSMSGKKVVLAACDTFRAAAVEQLRIWSERANVDFINQGQGADSAAVAFDAISHAVSKGKDVVIIDTAGRLHTRSNLMEELKKVHRVIGKASPGAPSEVLLVLDATTGQNGLVQAKKFKEAVDVTGIVLTKLDGTAKGGIIFAIVKELGIPVRYVGVGEKEDDLKPFDSREFVNALLSSGEESSEEV
ncbi:signal recognition particle-docking protein FtsY [Mesotoga sp.]|uniref:signal recognition particle-docking protein FtsY n=1 Tax=Mesotoga sp. TaxID=2053577 RepID=UPI0016BAD9FC|nr:signal recognition particle-docking protein FtsY [Mesotoga sp.]MDI9367358.1 signal recognition particle-docking protein FtsY [Thermotogota bacterium]NLT45139.1 signal recognition particle-docking protein FtsY [Thermotogaceae bacterium]MDD3680675.1 signal recognition particle-docking protein FtsY [Mesotoga sp.]MDD4208045.1 signal recognition particle-docking protein FtsY [Mesotoga sp.]MDD5682790.1 signal recognition particle-docking protein FtsY [Mesotoga sp.]